MVTKISVLDALKLDCVFVDTRSPGEFNAAHIPGAVNIPIFSNEERIIIGTMYKKEGKDTAITKGVDLFLPKIKEIMVSINSFDKPVVVYCWRGGMRSRGVCSLFLGLEIYQLEGGHKGYRKFVRESLEKFDLKFEVVLLCGLTGSGKTKMLSKFENSLDLEGLANHRGSLFGGVGLKKRSQKMFEALLLNELIRLNKFSYVVIEGESRKVGDILVPDFLFKAMRKGKKVYLEVGLDSRADIILEEYGKHMDEAKEVILKMEKRIGKKVVETLVHLLDKGSYKEVVKYLLEKYYDPLYSHTMKEFDFDVKVSGYSGFKEFVNCLG